MITNQVAGNWYKKTTNMAGVVFRGYNAYRLDIAIAIADSITALVWAFLAL